jgi:hypothetical protein
MLKPSKTCISVTGIYRRNLSGDIRLIDSCRYCQIALAYSDTPDLRATWLNGLASLHEKSENYAEAAICKMHVAALVADYLEQSGKLSNCKNFDASIFTSICPGISESAVRTHSHLLMLFVVFILFVDFFVCLLYFF